MVKVKNLFVTLTITVVVSGSVLAQDNASKMDSTLESVHKTDTKPMDESHSDAADEITISEDTDSGQGGGPTYTVWRGSEPY